jgi:hypothetical protein
MLFLRIQIICGDRTFCHDIACYIIGIMYVESTLVGKAFEVEGDDGAIRDGY